MEVKIFEQGNGFPEIGAIVEAEGKLYRVAETNGWIHTSDRAGISNYIYATLTAACDDDGPVFPARVLFEPRAEFDGDSWSVVDPTGGRWWPNDEATAAIEASDTPAATALRICQESPLRGEWHS